MMCLKNELFFYKAIWFIGLPFISLGLKVVRYITRRRTDSLEFYITHLHTTSRYGKVDSRFAPSQ